MEFAATKKTEDLLQVDTYKKMPIAVERGEGSFVWTCDGERYLDLYGGHAVCATGHSHPRVVKAIKDQAEKLMFYSNLVYSDIRARAAESLLSKAPAGTERVFFCNSGTEANENAMRMARMRTGRSNVVSFEGGFHGRTADSISATFLGKYRRIGRPNVPGHICARFGDIESVRTAVDDDTAAIILEPIQSMAGIIEAEPGFFIDLRELCNERGIVLIFDEVQTGVGRTGSWFFSGSENAGGVVPDILTLAKSLGSGVPVGACLVTSELAKSIKINDLGTTFGGGMIAMAAVAATLEAIEDDGMMGNALAVESYLRRSLASVEGVVGVRGKGCLLGIEFERPCADVHQRSLDEKIITGASSDPNVLRLLPPLCVPIGEVERFVEVLLT
ncbi:MAG TPA: aminotransferase class III-fold pyridoxal phosphate-dependent enzyme [Pyrinomonadaceae bacterium]|nr:aminotransferase class III-fold pyridoxal phosphate-dependent enzyme [Pyrinomonadaceae bacterium]